jgi:hypothetical protein
MKLEVLRYSSQDDDTLGLLFDVTDDRRRFMCFTLEDEYRTRKKYGETRIPAGTYEIKLRTVGGFHGRYKRRFSFHRGMLWLQDVPNFQYVLIHIGNVDDDTAGCLLVGDAAVQNVTGTGRINRSAKAYERVYQKIVVPLLEGRSVHITYIDYDA